MRLAVSLLGATLVSGSAKAKTRARKSTTEKDGCWSNHYVAELCCDGAWGGSGCWEDNRSYDRCCRDAKSKAPSRSAGKAQAGSSTCKDRLRHIASSLSFERIAGRIAEPVEFEMRQSLHDLANFTGPHLQRSSLTPYLTGLTPFERQMLLALVAILAGVFEARGITFWLHGSALRGALQHYGPEPWAQSVSLAAFAPTAEEITGALLSGAKAVQEAPTNSALGQFGPIIVTPTALNPSCGGNCGHWVVSFARGLTFRAASPEAGPRVPSVEVAWLDSRGESPGWRLYYGDPMPLSHRKLLALSLPVLQGRPFAHLRLPVPRAAWKLQEDAPKKRGKGKGKGGAEASVAKMQTCHLPQSLHPHGDLSVTSLPCAAMAAMFPMVLLHKSFSSVRHLLAELGLQGDLPRRQAAVASAIASSGRPSLSLSIEASVDAVRGASVLLVAEENGAGSRGGPWTCWLPVYGSHVLVTSDAES